MLFALYCCFADDLVCLFVLDRWVLLSSALPLNFVIRLLVVDFVWVVLLFGVGGWC